MGGERNDREISHFRISLDLLRGFPAVQHRQTHIHENQIRGL